jgi:Peptidase family S64
MAKYGMDRRSIPSPLLDAKNAAAAQFLSTQIEMQPMAFAASSNPKHNVVGVGIGRKIVRGKPTTQPCVRFYVERKIPKGSIPGDFVLPEKMKGIATDVVETGRFRAFAGAGKERARIRPARPGCSVGFALSGAQAGSVMAGTFGALVEAGGKQFILSNNHVLANQNALPIGSDIFQPGLLDLNTPAEDAIAKLSTFVTLQTASANQVDCAIAEVDDPKLVSSVVMPMVGKLKSGAPLVAALGMKVEKTGRTTGYTTGTIQDISANVKVSYEIGPLTFSDQIIIVGGTTNFSDAGDSGSLIVEQTAKQPVALLFAGTSSHTIANHIEDVLNQLKVSIIA